MARQAVSPRAIDHVICVFGATPDCVVMLAVMTFVEANGSFGLTLDGIAKELGYDPDLIARVVSVAESAGFARKDVVTGGWLCTLPSAAVTLARAGIDPKATALEHIGRSERLATQGSLPPLPGRDANPPSVAIFDQPELIHLWSRWLSRYMRDAVMREFKELDINPGTLVRPTVSELNGWNLALGRLMRKKVPPQEIRETIDFVASSEFWLPNCRSPGGLYRKWDKLKASMVFDNRKKFVKETVHTGRMSDLKNKADELLREVGGDWKSHSR